MQSLIKSAAHLQVLKLLLCLCDYLLLKPELGLSFLNGLAASLPKKSKDAAEDIFCFFVGGFYSAKCHLKVLFKLRQVVFCHSQCVKEQRSRVASIPLYYYNVSAIYIQL